VHVSFASIAAAILAILTLAGCTNPITQQQQREAEIKAADAALDKDRILVQSGDLSLPHQQLGSLEYSEPFSPAANEETHVDERLREMAIQKWGNQVDAITGVKADLSADARELHVTGEAVRILGDCSFCRHQGGYPQVK
jgi:uncharacterized lipoprotein